MGSRIEKYYIDNENDSQYEASTSTRSGRNARLYKQVYGRYGDLDNLPLDDNTDEIDMERLRQLVTSSQKKEEKEIKESLSVLEQRKRKIDEQRVYDINKILEKAKYENNKLKDTTTNLPKINHNILATLKSNELSLDEIKKASEEYHSNHILEEPLETVQHQIEEKDLENKLSMTRELKYQNLIQEAESEININKEQSLLAFNSSQEMLDENLSLDLFEDLKPTGNTIVTKPIKEDKNLEIKQIKSDFHSSDTRDIDIIKTDKKEENDFFTSSYEFSKKDFAVDEDFEELKNKSGIFKVLLLILAITIFIGVIVYFVGTYGLGI